MQLFLLLSILVFFQGGILCTSTCISTSYVDLLPAITQVHQHNLCSVLLAPNVVVAIVVVVLVGGGAKVFCFAA